MEQHFKINHSKFLVFVIIYIYLIKQIVEQNSANYCSINVILWVLNYLASSGMPEQHCFFQENRVSFDFLKFISERTFESLGIPVKLRRLDQVHTQSNKKSRE